MAGSFTFRPVGVLHCDRKYRFEAPRQAVFAAGSGWVELDEHCNYEAALADLAGFERIWLIYVFHLNGNWRPKVKPPVAPPGRKVGVFATRAPYRPNPIGISAVELEKVEGRRLFIRNFDLLDGTPVLDIKPYIPAVDAFAGAACGWLEEADRRRYDVILTAGFRSTADWLLEHGGPDLANFCRVQLAFSPLDRRRKRLSCEHLPAGQWEIGCRTWRIRFALDEEAQRIEVLQVTSNYTADELEPAAEDRYCDKALHRAFRRVFGIRPAGIAGPDAEFVQ